MTRRNSKPLMNAFLGIFMLLPLILMTSGCQDSGGQSTADGTSTPETGGQQPTGPTNRPTLRWETPATREDGSRLDVSDIKEYRIYYRLRHQSGFDEISQPVSEGSAFTLNQFKPGAYLFSVTVVDTEGLESRRSDGVAVDLI